MMKKFISYILILLLIISSFYYADKISKMVINKSKLMKQIKKEKVKYETNSVDAIISDDYIIPGINGKKVNEIESYYNMKKYNTFIKNKLIFKEDFPSVSLENNKELIIKSASPLKNAISILIKDNKDAINYSKNLDITLLVTNKTFDYKKINDQINVDYDNIKVLDETLNKYNKNTKIYIIDSKLDNYKNNYLVKPSFILNNISIVNKDEISSGDIIYICDDLTLENYKLLLVTINFKNLKVMGLSKLISENNN